MLNSLSGSLCVPMAAGTALVSPQLFYWTCSLLHSFIHSTSPNISQCIHHAPYAAPLLAFVPNSASCRHPSLPRGPRVTSLQPFASRWLRPRWPSWWSSYGNMMALRRACCPSSTGNTRRRMSRANNPPAEPVPPTGVYTATRLTPVHVTAHGGAMEHSHVGVFL